VFHYQDLSDAELGQLYEEANVLLQVSKYEGFGWPIVEANSHGTPAICSDEPVFREVGSGNVFISDDLQLTDWPAAVALVRAPETPSRARKNAGRYSMVKFSERLEHARTSAYDSTSWVD
jgi:glycosyltransferase involved in cell wall biosynthesis